ncbi:TetR family transcriptional regulator [Luteibacter aegosomaticola]|uniref:TetR/AcrR family transcriptional regulator n=1 Tax=Luteibacter aegosomaticola TaxID=2911538 RepID=UPI001FF85C10|nr:TetR/AcrR family transcriptional regulator [Luteibacter aegosomaticola]UPG89439.1 TetR family transcriptional regulator [Luteibacter aegosomaticola]
MSAKEKILTAAVGLLEEQGVDGLTTRAVCEAAGVTAPTLYHHFGDKNGLVRAIVNEGVAEFMAMKRALRVTNDPLADLRRGWDGWITFGLERPTLFRLMIEAARNDPTLAQASYEHMEENVVRLEATNGLNVELAVAVHAVWAAASGMQALFMQGLEPTKLKATSRFLFKALSEALVAKP